MAYPWIIFKILHMQYSLVSLLMAFTAIVAVLQVALSTYGHRCHHPALRFLQWGASAVFIPLTAYIISYYMTKIKTMSCEDERYYLLDCSYDPFSEQCMPGFFTELLIVWTVLIQIIKGNTDIASAAVVTEALPVHGEAGGSRPFVELLAYSIWTTGLLLYYHINVKFWRWVLMLPICVIYSIKVVVKLTAFHRARGSFALGRNVNVIAGYMTQVYDFEEDGAGRPPRYIVIGEEKQHLEKTPNGYRIKACALEGNAITCSTLLTLDKIWPLWASGDPLLSSQSLQLRDLCLSFALFKSLRRRFAGYPLVEAGSPKALDFVLSGMLADADDHGRTFRVLIDELAFASNFYYSCLPWPFIGGWLAILYIFVSLLIVLGVFLMGTVLLSAIVLQAKSFYLIITFILTVAVLVMELWAMMSGMRSNWTKLALLHHYIKNNGNLCYAVKKVVAMVLRFGAVKRFDDKFGQNTMLEPRRFYKPPILLPKKLFHRASLLKSVDVPPEVKAAVLASLGRNSGRLSNGTAAILRSSLRDDIIWSCQGDHVLTVDILLVWHIGTSLFEMKYQPHNTSSPRTADMITATHLSQYCSYLVAAVPDMLPDDATWTKVHYREVTKDIKRSLGPAGGNNCYSHLVESLGASSRHRILQDGSKLAKHLVREVERQEEEGDKTRDEAAVWELLAEFWSEMVLYLAPSDNIKGHIEALSRGGEFITLLWALLLHAGITSRPCDVTEP
uniref:DUF4220 domain-containing protein n=1 Tax=Oryza meridionalis TaxID=40149 RepID=A0A0E0C301_9ORYZ